MAASYEHPGMLYPNPYIYATDPSLPPPTTAALTLGASKRPSPPNASGSPRAAKRSRKSGQMTASPMMSAPHGAMGMATDPALLPTEAASPVAKPRRVRTGCLTCRERHLKCDEAQPICLNCRKSNRQCKRGVRLNFIDTTVRQPPFMAAIHDWDVTFHDESREIASEYRGGLARYGGAQEDSDRPYHVAENGLLFDFSGQQQMHQGGVPPIQGLPDPFEEEAAIALATAQQQREQAQRFAVSRPEAAYTAPIQQQHAPAVNSHMAYGYGEHAPVGEKREYIREAKELSYMQAFVENVGLWMDTMDPEKHFSEQLPHLALSNAMLHNALLACGARHLSLTDPSSHTPDTSLQYYNTATSYLLQALQLPPSDRDSVTCATTATILNVYEVMSERHREHINHIKGARALIKECGWNARSKGVGAACFWLNVGMQVLGCLARGDAVAWDPDEWGVDLDFTAGPPAHRHDELWAQRILYIVAKIANLRAATNNATPPSAGGRPDTPLERQARAAEWQNLRNLLTSWHQHAPRSMHPLAYIPPFKSLIPSAFPNIYLIKRVAIMARLLYHTGHILLAKLNPHAGLAAEMREHAMAVCGIVAHLKDAGGVSSIAIRALAVAGEVLDEVGMQREVLDVLRRVSRGTGWNVQDLFKELPQKWEWPQADTPHDAEAIGGAERLQPQCATSTSPPMLIASSNMQQRLQNSPPLRQQQQGPSPPRILTSGPGPPSSTSRHNSNPNALATLEFQQSQYAHPPIYSGTAAAAAASRQVGGGPAGPYF